MRVRAPRVEGYTCVELAATLAGEPLYRSCGYEALEHFISRSRQGVEVPLISMGKPL